MLLAGAMLLDLKLRNIVRIQEPAAKELSGASSSKGADSAHTSRSNSPSGPREGAGGVIGASQKLTTSLAAALFSSCHLVLQRPYSYANINYLDQCIIRPLLERDRRASCREKM